jgi:predicted enzyme related to lactoylglutathione lyase
MRVGRELPGGSHAQALCKRVPAGDLCAPGKMPPMSLIQTQVQVTSVTVGIPAPDLAASRAWYYQVFEKPSDLEPVPGIVDFEIGGVWVQLMGGDHEAGAPGWVLLVGVPDREVKRQRLVSLGVEVGEVETAPDVISYFTFHDPDGNELSWYRVADSESP